MPRPRALIAELPKGIRATLLHMAVSGRHNARMRRTTRRGLGWPPKPAQFSRELADGKGARAEGFDIRRRMLTGWKALSTGPIADGWPPCLTCPDRPGSSLTDEVLGATTY